MVSVIFIGNRKDDQERSSCPFFIADFSGRPLQLHTDDVKQNCQNRCHASCKQAVHVRANGWYELPVTLSLLEGTWEITQRARTHQILNSKGFVCSNVWEEWRETEGSTPVNWWQQLRPQFWTLCVFTALFFFLTKTLISFISLLSWSEDLYI